jgi:hypothetical protein
MSAIMELAGTVDQPRFQPDQVALVLGWSRVHAMSELAWGRNLTTHLPAVWAAWQAGDLDRYRAWIFTDVLLTLFDDNPALARAIADQVLPSAADMPCARLRQKLRRLLLKADADACAKRTAMTLADRHVFISPGTESGTASLGGVHLPAARVAAAFERVDAIARARRNDGDQRTLAQLRADTFCDLLEGVGIGALPVARSGVVELTIPLATATGHSDEPGELAGYGPIVADVARQIAAARDDAEWRFSVSQNGELIYAGVTKARPDHAASAATDAADATDAIAVAHKPLPPIEANPYRRLPGAKLRRWIAARDRRCQAPGCRAPARVCDVDHVIDHARGDRTVHSNLILLCRWHHRAKHLGFLTPIVIRPGLIIWATRTGQLYWNDD